jgi:hypothetical protein
VRSGPGAARTILHFHIISATESSTNKQLIIGKGDCVKEGGGEEGDRERARASGVRLVGPVRNPVLQHRVRQVVPLVWVNRTQNSRVAGARPHHQPIGGSGAHPGLGSGSTGG